MNNADSAYREKKLAQVAPSGEKNISELMLQFQPIFSSTFIDENILRIKNDVVDSILWGADLAPGIQILDWKATIHQGHDTITLEPESSDSEPVWTLLLSNYPFVAPMQQVDETQTRPHLNNMSYLYNLECPLHFNLRPSPKAHLVFIRIKQKAWQQVFSQPPSFLADFIAARDPRFYGIPLSHQQQSILANRFKQRPTKATDRWHCLADTLLLANDTFSQLEQRHANAPKHQALHPLDSKRITLAHDLLLASFQSAPDLEKICHASGLGRDKFRRLFRQVYGVLPYKYFQQRRMEEARRMLESGLYSVMATGHEVGYSHMGHFAQTFKKHHGCLPSEVAEPS